MGKNEITIEEVNVAVEQVTREMEQKNKEDFTLITRRDKKRRERKKETKKIIGTMETN